MSWDLMIMRLNDDVTMETLPNDFPPIGTSAELMDIFRSLFPEIIVEKPNHAFLKETDYSIEFSLGKDEPVKMIILLVHGSGGALRPISEVCRRLNCRALDCDQGDIIDFEAEGY